MYTIKRQNVVSEADYCSITDLTDFLYKNHQRTQHFKIDPSRYTTLCGIRGAFFAIPAFSFKGMNGEVPSRYVDVYITENFDPLDIIASSLSTSSADTLLNCAWQFRIEAFQDGEVLELSAPMKLSFPVLDSKSYANHSIYSGSHSTIQVLNSDRDFDWKLRSDIVHYSTAIGDKEYVYFSIDSLGWTALASTPVYKGRKEMISVRLDQKMKSFTDLKAYLLYPDIGGVSYLHANNYGLIALNVPEFVPANVLIIGYKEGQFWLGKALRQSREKFIQLALTPIPEEKIWEEIAALSN
jgi:hypothetical protein